LFHDLKKGWTCCNQIVYDWDEFEKIVPCTVGAHTDKDPNASGDQGDFYKSGTVGNAQKALDKEEQAIKIRSIDDFNREEEEKRKKAEADRLAKEGERKVFVTPSGKHKCSNKGCLKEFDPTTNEDQSCNYHPGEPIFHDLKKFWSCCQAETWDWDEFVKLPTCKVGKHTPKYA